jgi:hypothetical protein
MKKIKIVILSAIALLVFTTASQAQYKSLLGTIPATAGANPSGADSVASNGVTAAYLYTPKLTLNYKQVSFQVYARRVSSVMNGKVLLEGSNDGVNWTALSTTDSIHISNGATDVGDRFIVLTSSSTAYPDDGVNNLYYRAKCTQIAGDTAYVKVKMFGRQ